MSRLALIVCLVAASPRSSPADDPPELRMSKPVVVAKVHGFANFEPLHEATLTADDKLMIYYEPSGFAIEKDKEGFRAALLQDGRLRKKGAKDVLWQKAPMFEYEPKGAVPPYRIYMRSDMSIKGLPPGDYELDLTLRDRLTKGTKAMRTVGFKVVPAKEDDGPGVQKSEGIDPEAESKRHN